MNNSEKTEAYKEAFRLLGIAEQLLIYCYIQHSIKQAQNDKNK